MTNQTRYSDKEGLGYRVKAALKLGATLAVLSLVAVIAPHAPRYGGDASALEAATARPMPNAAMPGGKLYYMPDEYELHAPADSEEAAPTF